MLADDDGGAAFVQLGNHGGQDRHGIGGQVRTGLVEQQNSRIMPERGGDGDALLLAAGELQQGTLHNPVQHEPTHERLDARLNIRGLSTEILQGEGQLIDDRRGEELTPRVLQHRAGTSPYLLESALSHVEVGNRDPTGQSPFMKMRDEPVHHPQESGFPRPARTAQHDQLARLDREIDVAQSRHLRRRVLPGRISNRNHRKPLMTQQAAARTPVIAPQSRSGRPSRGGTRLVGR